MDNLRSMVLAKSTRNHPKPYKFAPEDPKTLTIAEQAQELAEIRQNLNNIYSISFALEYLRSYDAALATDIYLLLYDACKSSLFTQELAGFVFELQYSNFLPLKIFIELISDIIFDVPEEIVRFHNIIEQLTQLDITDRDICVSFSFLAINYARLSEDRECEGLTLCIDRELRNIYKYLPKDNERKSCWFYIYSMRGNQALLLSCEFVEFAMEVCEENQFDVSEMAEGIANCDEQVQQLKAEGFTSEYMYSLSVPQERLHAMLNTGDEQVQALKTIICTQPQLSEEDQELVWMIMLLLRCEEGEEVFEFFCDKLGYLDIVKRFLGR